MIKCYDYNLEKYNFVKLVQDLFDREALDYLHEDLSENYEFFDRPGADSDTRFHKIFYDRLRAGWPEFVELYQEFIRDFIAPTMNITSNLIYQKWPSFRIHLPDNVAVGGWHRDADYNHPVGEINFILALTPMFESNTTITESVPGKMDFRQIECDPGQVVQFDGSQCTHGNLPNKTGVTRVSFDFRILKKEDYNPHHDLESLSKGNKFLIGHYYELMEL